MVTLLFIFFVILGFAFCVIFLYFIFFPFRKNKGFDNLLANGFIRLSENINNFKDLVDEKKKQTILEKNDEYKIKVEDYYTNTLGFLFDIDECEVEGIDIVAYKDDEIHLIQYTNHLNNPTKEMFISFLGNCDIYIQKNNEKIKNKVVKKTFITACDKVDYNIQKWLEENHNIINYIKI